MNTSKESASGLSSGSLAYGSLAMTKNRRASGASNEAILLFGIVKCLIEIASVASLSRNDAVARLLRLLLRKRLAMTDIDDFFTDSRKFKF